MSRPIRVALLTFYFEAWDAFAELHRMLLADPRFEVLVVAVPRKLTGDAGFDDASGVSAFLNERNIEHQNWAFDDQFEAGRRLREWHPDYVFLNYPWQRNYQKGLRPDQLVQFTRIAYVPYYSLSLVREPGTDGSFSEEVAPHYFTQRTHQLASLVFAPSSSIKKAFATTSRGDDGVVVVGSTKLDALVAEVAAVTQVGDVAETRAHTRITWAPHHSYSPHWLNFGNFAETCWQMLDLARNNAQTEFVLRAHPFMFGTLTDRSVMTAAEVADWQAQWAALPNTSDGAELSLAEVFDTDLLVTDGISFLAEYPLAVGRPSLFIERPDHWRFSEPGELAAAASVRVSVAEVADRVQRFIDGEALPALMAEIAALRAATMPNPGSSAAAIKDALLAHWATAPVLVDPARITDIAWELQPGREPLD